MSALRESVKIKIFCSEQLRASSPASFKATHSAVNIDDDLLMLFMIRLFRASHIHAVPTEIDSADLLLSVYIGRAFSLTIRLSINRLASLTFIALFPK